MTVIDLQFRLACRDVEEACAEILEITKRTIARVKAEEILRNNRDEAEKATFTNAILARTKAAIESEEWRRPSDTEPAA